MNNYLKMMINNHKNYDDDHHHQYGGQSNSESSVKPIDIPTGCFLPIIICDENEETKLFEEEEKRKREYATNKNAVSIKTIMEKRRNVVPFISS